MSVALQSKAMDCATECFFTFKMHPTVSQALTQAIAECGGACIETARSCEVGSVLPELLERCRVACEACIETRDLEESALQQAQAHPPSLQRLKLACSGCLEAISN